MKVWHVAALLLGASGSIDAQQADAARIGMAMPSPAMQSQVPSAQSSEKRANSPLTVTLASAVVPGTGQILLRQRRAAAYLALEAAGVAVYIARSRDGRSQRSRYREIARTVARSTLSPGGPDGDWDYYERMEKYIASGEFDLVPGGPIEPETDEETYNGSVWLLARQTYWRDPGTAPDPGSAEYAAAMRFYEDRAAGVDMRWSWAGKSEDFGKFRAAIDASNSAFRSAGHTASLVIANHFLSAIDAYVSVRTRLRREPNGATTVTASVPIRY
ncbi:MAG TPA: hypothetical protein VFX40_01875 [Gemmatimonadaceae bacterium]|nr:hypothetical protein [Gemmatimonadaceae bacterium]